MKVYFATVIAIGIMFFLLLAGVETNSSSIINYVAGNNPGGWQSSGLWIVAIIGFAAFAATSRIVILGNSIQASSEAVMAVFVSSIYVTFVSDMYSIVTKVASTSCPSPFLLSACSWDYFVIWAIIIPLMAGYTISLIEFIRGAD